MPGKITNVRFIVEFETKNLTNQIDEDKQLEEAENLAIAKVRNEIQGASFVAGKDISFDASIADEAAGIISIAVYVPIK